MLSKHVTKIIQSLEKKKFRDKYNLFKTEGEKLVKELLLSDLDIDSVIACPEWIEKNRALLKNRNIVEVNAREMRTLSNFPSPPEVIALARIPQPQYQKADIGHSLSLILNGIQDPGNLGTILRVSDWFGIRHVFCDSDCAGSYNPKCVQASMGALFRIKVIYTEILPLLQEFRAPGFCCYGTFLEGDNIYRTSLNASGFIVMGNEGSGIRPEIEKQIDKRLTIPSFAENENSTESLNVGVATGIILSEFKRKFYSKG